MYKTIIRSLFFLFDPEKIHRFTFSLIKIFSSIPGVPAILRSQYQITDKKLERNLFGLTFKNPVGLAAGFLTDRLFTGHDNKRLHCNHTFHLHKQEVCSCFPWGHLREQWRHCSSSRGILAVALLLFFFAVITGETGPPQWN